MLCAIFSSPLSATLFSAAVSYKATWALRFLFGRGNSVESKLLRLELESAKTFACHMLLGE